jgi:hypothetical protein
VGWGASRHLHQLPGLPSAEALGYFRDAPPGLDGCGFGGRALLQFPSAAEASHLLVLLARLDPCPCGSGRRFQELLHALRMLLTGAGAGIMSASEGQGPTSRKRREKWGTLSMISSAAEAGHLSCLFGILRLRSGQAMKPEAVP